jgi:hypothetical protein
MKVPTARNGWIFCTYPFRPVPVIVAGLLLLSIGFMPVAGQLVAIHFAVSPSTPTADQPLTFSFDASNVRGRVVAIVILAGAECSPTAMIVSTLPVLPTVTYGSVSLPSGLGIGRYSAFAFIVTSGTGQFVTETASCLPFTVS